jgi:hypothetical protein
VLIEALCFFNLTNKRNKMSDSLDSGLASSDAMKLNAASKSFLLESAKWAKFLAVIGFVMIGLMILVMIIGASFASGAGFIYGCNNGYNLFFSGLLSFFVRNECERGACC